MDTAELGICPQCRGPLLAIEAGMSCGVKCSSCDWSVVTTNHNTPPFDQTRYQIFLLCSPENRLKTIAAIANLLGASSATLRQLVSEGKPIIEGLAATEVQTLYRQFSSKGIAMEISPAFPWPLDEPSP